MSLPLPIPIPVPVPEPTPEAIRFYQTGIWLWGFATAWGVAMPAALAASGFGPWVVRRLAPAAWAGRRPYATVTLVFGAWWLAATLLDLPLALYASYLRPRAYGLSHQALSQWLGDVLKATGIGLALGAAAVWFPYWLLRRSPRAWWIWTSLALLPVILCLVLVSPVVVDPLFDDFGPMRDRALEARILALAARAGIDGGRVFEVAKSVETGTVNAYVTGLAGSHRIVLWDTLLAKLEPAEVEAVMAHEMAHFTLRHVETGVLATWGLATLGLFGLDRLGRRLDRRRDRPGRAAADPTHPLADPGRLPAAAALVAALSLALLPWGLALSRHQEHEADRFALELLRDNRAVASAFVRLQRENLSYPRPARWLVLARSTHPPLGERIDFANTYRPWERGEPGRYEHRFRPAGDTLPPQRPLR